MKKRLLFVSVLLMVFCVNYVSAASCSPNVKLLSQDSYPAIPGEYVKLVFQIDNVASSECNNLEFELLEKYPIIFDSGTSAVFKFGSTSYQRQFSSFVTVPYKVRIDETALEGDNPIETSLKIGSVNYLNEFNLSVQDLRADFEIHIDKYSYATKDLTLEILNIADSDVKALTLEIPKQDNIKISGSNVNVVGDLDSNEYTTADFVAIPKDGEINVKILYTDTDGTRREIIKQVNFDSSYFIPDKGKKFNTFYIVLIVLIGIVVYTYYHKRRKKKLLKKHKAMKEE